MDSTNWFSIRHILLRIRKFACFWSTFEQYSVLAICPWNPKQQRRSKKSTMVWISRQIRFWPVPESTYNAQNSQFDLVMYQKVFITILIEIRHDRIRQKHDLGNIKFRATMFFFRTSIKK